MTGGSSIQWDPVWRLTDSSKVLYIVIDEVSGALSIHVAPPAIRIIVVPAGVTVLLGLHNPACSWTGTMGPSLPGFTIAPHVVSLLCYRIDQTT
jgi:hypothetical protein